MNPTTSITVQDFADDHNQNPGEEGSEVDEACEELYGEEDFVFIENSELEQGGKEEIGDSFLKAYANFMNKLGHFQFIPQKTIQIISSEFLEHSIKSLKQREVKLRASLKEANLYDVVVEEISSERVELKLQTEEIHRRKL